jgi:multicomponent Na+:H+ antiporter subunit F
MMLALAATGVLAACAAIALMRLIAGPTLYDRALAGSAICVLCALACAGVGVASGHSGWIDAALALMLAGLVANAATMKFFRVRSFQPPLSAEAPIARSEIS